MKQRFLKAYPTRLAFLVAAGITAVVIIQVQSIINIPAKIRHALG